MCDAFVEREPKACAVETITVETATRTLEFIFKKKRSRGKFLRERFLRGNCGVRILKFAAKD